MSYTNGLDKPTDYFNTVLYTGNGSSGRGVTGVGFSPNWVWIKNRGTTGNHQTFDTIRGVTNTLQPDRNIAETAVASMLTAFDSDGFTVGDHSGVNDNTNTYVSWNWLAGGSASSNTDGSITSTVSANTTAGFSILTFTGTGSSATVGHGLGAVPKAILFKKTSGAQGWGVYHDGVGNTGSLRLDGTDGTTTSSDFFNNTSPTSSVFTVNVNNSVNNSGGTMLAYCFTEKKGYSKFGSYTGNGNADGTFVYTGFKPAWVMIKNADASESWLLMDNKRPTAGNPNDKGLFANSSSAEETGVNRLDFLSNGFKQRINAGTNNQSGINYIYMAFAENPFVTSTGIPTTAR